jgi:dihydrofolate reductase
MTMEVLMTKLTYTAIASLDGFIEDEHGNFDWAFPGPDVHAFVNQLERPVGLYLYGRRMYETMVFWETQGGKSAGIHSKLQLNDTRTFTNGFVYLSYRLQG